MCDQRHPKNIACKTGSFLNRLGYLYSAPFAAPTRMDLCLDHHAGCARTEQILCRSLRFRYGLRHFATRHRDPVLLQDSLGLVFMNFHKIADWTYRQNSACRLWQRIATFDFIEPPRIGQTCLHVRLCHGRLLCWRTLIIQSMITEALQRIANRRESLSREEARAVMTEVFSGRASDAQIAALLVALHMKGESVEEIVGFAEAIRGEAAPLPIHENASPAASGTERDALVDTCGTGGDASGTFNISTTTAFVVAGAGVRVAKHGNRSLSSRCGSADVMEALGVKISLPTAVLATCLEEVGIVFLFAPTMHSAMKYVQPARRELRLRTIFNLLGPLTNPAHATAQ